MKAAVFFVVGLVMGGVFQQGGNAGKKHAQLEPRRDQRAELRSINSIFINVTETFGY
jgi:hypothetical protein